MGGANVVEQLRGRQRIKIRLGKPARQLSPGNLGRQRDTLAAPLQVLSGLAGDELPKEEIHDAGTHRLQHTGCCVRPPCIQGLCGFWWVVHDDIVFEHIFEYKGCAAPVNIPRSTPWPTFTGDGRETIER